MRHRLALLAFALLLPSIASGMTDEEALALVKLQDERQNSVGDYRALVFIEQKERNKNDQVYEAMVYRRDLTEKMVILFVRPKEEAGKGYLRVDKNLLLYDPTVGKWERRTELERIGGTSDRRQYFDSTQHVDVV